ncbi:MAG: UxaA family hydrolase [Candidatus Hermodarchaeota archaeon]
MPTQLKSFIVMSLDDNCATALEDVQKDLHFQIMDISITLNHNIPLGHKIALTDIKKGDSVKKYGQIIGIATENITKGDWIHTHNLSSQYIMEVSNNG